HKITYILFLSAKLPIDPFKNRPPVFESVWFRMRIHRSLYASCRQRRTVCFGQGQAMLQRRHVRSKYKYILYWDYSFNYQET
ncbi:MAG TPA: hypothetical protein DCW46_06725, partial [Desulfotomaculum sp.]|nr:hypothetical protein [Desulfotomaculum sp.]